MTFLSLAWVHLNFSTRDQSFSPLLQAAASGAAETRSKAILWRGATGQQLSPDYKAAAVLAAELFC
jgi:hypothetical protein